MPGSSLLGTLLLGTGYLYTPSLSVGSKLAYNGYDFTINTIIRDIVNIHKTAENTLNTWNSIRTTGQEYDLLTKEKKVINVSGTIIGTSSIDLESKIDAIKRALAIPNKLLEYRRRDNKVVASYAVPMEIDIPEEHYNLTFIRYSVNFIVLDPFLYDTTLVETEYTAKSASFVGSTDVTSGTIGPAPFVLLQFGAGTSLTSISVKVGGVDITITSTFVSGDTLLINHKNKEVMKNGVTLLTYTGSFSTLIYGSTTIEVTFNGTVLADVYILHYPTYE